MRARGVAVQVDPERRQPHLRTSDSEIAGHEIDVVPAHWQERVHVRARFADQIERLLTVWIAKPVKKQILTLQRAADRHLESAPQWLRQSEEERVRQIDDVEFRLAHEPIEELAYFLPLKTALASKH